MLAVGPVPDDLLANRSQLHAVLAHLGLGSGLGCEVGVHRGQHAEEILASWPGELWLVDAWKDIGGGPAEHIDWGGDHRQLEYLGECLVRMTPFAHRVRYLRRFSPAAAGEFSDGSFDFVYIDATHGYRAVAADIAAWYPKVREGGLLCGHDYYDGLHGGHPVYEYGVKTAVDEFAAATGHEVFASRSGSNWYMVAPVPPVAVPMG